MGLAPQAGIKARGLRVRVQGQEQGRAELCRLEQRGTLAAQLLLIEASQLPPARVDPAQKCVFMRSEGLGFRV